MKNAFSALVGVILLCALLSPLTQKNKIDFELFETYFAQLEEDEKIYEKKSEDAAVSVAEKGYENELKRQLSKSGLNVLRLRAVCGGDFKPRRVFVTLQKGTDEKKVRETVESLCKEAEVNIKWVKENEEQST